MGRNGHARGNWLAGGGELGELIRNRDWSTSPLGPPSGWPQSLRSAVSILLPSQAQICLFWGPDLVAIYNDEYRPALGIKHPWALGRPAREVWSEFWADVLEPLLEGVMTTGQAFWGSDYPFALERHGFPEETYFDISYDPVRDETGAVGGVFCIVSETTGRVIGERRLRALRDVGRGTIDAPDAGTVYERCARVLADYAHDVAFAAFYEWEPPARAAHLRSTVRLDAGSRAAPERIEPPGDGSWPLAAADPGGEVVLEEEDLARFGRLPGGAWNEAARRAMILPIANPGQDPFGYLVAGLSPRLAADERYRDFIRLVAAACASAVASAGARESERRRAEALAELDRAKTTFFSNVSHEFRTPLTLLLGPLQEELAQAGLSPGSRQRLEMAERNALRLLRLVNALLDFSRIEAGRAQARYAQVDLPALTTELASSFESACATAGLALNIDCEPLPEPAFVDAAMWEKVVLNLLSNAFKFTFEGAIDVTLRAREGRAVLRVRDTGIGIAEQDHPLLFERFRRVEGARARTHEGSGIGLALVRELVRLHGGDIRVESQPGKGSAFEVEFPLGKAHLPPERIVSEDGHTNAGEARAFAQEALTWARVSVPGASGASLSVRRERILVADDNADMRDYLGRLLREHWEVETVVDGDAALHALLTSRYDLFVTDVMMPGMDGFRLLSAIRAEEALRAIPVILLSARAGEEARIEGLEAGADDYLTKPFSARELVAQVRAHLAAATSRRNLVRERELLLASEREARMEAQRQWEDLGRLFEQAPAPMVILRGNEHRIELANEAACRAWGREPAQVLHKPLLEALPELRGQGFDVLLRDVMRTGEPYRGQRAPAALCRNGRMETRYFDFVYSPLRGRHGRPDGVFVIGHDVTDAVRMAAGGQPTDVAVADIP